MAPRSTVKKRNLQIFLKTGMAFLYFRLYFTADFVRKYDEQKGVRLCLYA